MATLDTPQLIASMLKNRGVYEEGGDRDPPTHSIIEYRNPYGYSVAVSYSARETLRYLACDEPMVLMLEGELTEFGAAWLAAFEVGAIPTLPRQRGVG